jgi:arylsulfatase A-like enzyme
MNMKRLLALSLAVFSATIFFVPAQAASTPNVIIIMADDQGYQDLGCFGSPKIKTPHIDRMAKEGMRFTDFYSGASVCTPSRAALLTGCYASRVGNLGVLFPRDKRGLNPDEITIADLLKTKGYATACIGKWHLGHLKEFLPTSQGFDTYFGVPYSNDMTLDPTQPLANDVVLREGVTLENIKSRVKKNLVPLMRDTEIIEYPADQNTLTKRYTEEAISFIKKNKEKPFFIYLPHTMPHIPLYATPPFEGKSKIGLYGDTIEELDWSTGQILETLRKLKLDQNTLVIYTSDNGPWKLATNSWVKGNMNRRVGGFAHPLKGYKFSRFEGGMRVPTVMWWPGRIPAGKECNEVAASMDFLPTCAALSGAKLPEDRVIDGKNLLPLMEGRKGAKSPHEAFFYRTEAVRSGKWKLKRNELYNLEVDAGETKNLAASNPEVVKRLSGYLAAHKEDLAKNKRPPGGPPKQPRKKKNR